MEDDVTSASIAFLPRLTLARGARIFALAPLPTLLSYMVYFTLMYPVSNFDRRMASIQCLTKPRGLG